MIKYSGMKAEESVKKNGNQVPAGPYICRVIDARVEGEAPDQFTYVDYLAKDMENNRVTVLPSYLKLQGKEAILHGRTIARRDGLSLVAIQLETGRAHQIRVQMQHAGYPLWGDHRYGNGKGKEQIALWGMRLSFAHPITKDQMLFIAPTPEEKPWLFFERELKGLETIWPQIKPAMQGE